MGVGMDKRPKTKTMRLSKHVAADYLATLDARVTGQKHHIPSGFPSLDRQLPAWLHQGHLIVIAGRPAMGKSAFCQQIVENVASEKRTTIMFTLEMSSYEITERAMSRRTGIPIPTLKTANGLANRDWERLTKAYAELSLLPFLIDDSTYGIDEIVAKTHAASTDLAKADLPPLGCVAIDYIQLVAAQAANRTLEVGQVTNKLKRLAKELSVPVVALSQLNRAAENRNDRRPTLADLRESGNIEQDADLVLFLYRDEYYNPDSSEKGVAEIIAAKNRHGATATTKLAFSGEQVRFGELPYV